MQGTTINIQRKIHCHTRQFITKGIRNFKTTHGISWNGLSHSLNQYLLACFRKQLLFPTSQLLCQFFLYIIKGISLFLPTNEGRPRYFSCWQMIWAPNLVLISSLTSSLVFWLKKREVLALFNCWSEASSYTLRIRCNESHLPNWLYRK